jgi:hypothetical protein
LARAEHDSDGVPRRDAACATSLGSEERSPVSVPVRTGKATSCATHRRRRSSGAGIVGYEYNRAGEYNQTWLEANEPKLYAILKRIYPGAV